MSRSPGAPSEVDLGGLHSPNWAASAVAATGHLTNGAGLDADEADLAAGNTRSATHGFVSLEHASGSNAAHDSKYVHLLRGLHRDFDVR